MTDVHSRPADTTIPGIPPRDSWPVEVLSGRACPSCKRLYSLVRPACPVEGGDDVTVCDSCARTHDIPVAGGER